MNKGSRRFELTRQSMHRYLSERDKPYYLKYDMRAMAAMRNEGQTLARIAPQFGITDTTVRNLLLKWENDNKKVAISS